MPYTPVTYNTGAGPGLDGPAFNAMETQYQEATLSFNPDLFTAFVYSGLVATKDATVLSQLDVTSGKAYLLQTDGTLRQRTLTSSTQTTATASTTYYLDLNPDGTWSWATAHSATANYLPIASVTTDASGNISAVTDARGLNTTLLSGMAGVVTIPNITVSGTLSVSGAASLAALTLSGALSGTTGSFSGAVTATAFHGNADTATKLLATSTFGWSAEDDGTYTYLENSTASGVARSLRHRYWNGSAWQNYLTIDHNTNTITFEIGGPHNTAAYTISVGNGAPAALGANEIYFQLT